MIVNGRSEASVKKAVDELSQLGKGKVLDTGMMVENTNRNSFLSVPYEKVFGCAADIGSASGAASAIEFIRSKGNLDILVNNLGIFEPKPFEQVCSFS